MTPAKVAPPGDRLGREGPRDRPAVEALAIDIVPEGDAARPAMAGGDDPATVFGSTADREGAK